jgi:hypothetical protein
VTIGNGFTPRRLLTEETPFNADEATRVLQGCRRRSHHGRLLRDV